MVLGAVLGKWFLGPLLGKWFLGPLLGKWFWGLFCEIGFVFFVFFEVFKKS